jgi:hypothetical protein
MHAEKQEYEMRIVEDFLTTQGSPPISMEHYEKPDVVVTLQGEADSAIRRIGIEVTCWFNDTNPGASSDGQRLHHFWASVREEIEKLKTKSGQLHKVHAYVELRKDELRQVKLGSLVKKLAAEIFAFVLKASETATSSVILIPEWKGQERVFSEFNGYPLVENYVAKVRVRKGFFAFWDANVNASYVGISPKQLAKIIVEKGGKAKDYDKQGLDELWLLIAAPHDTVFNAMHDCPEQAHLDDPAVLAACGDTPFHKIFFWSSPPHEWAKQIWPKTS